MALEMYGMSVRLTVRTGALVVRPSNSRYEKILAKSRYKATAYLLDASGNRQGTYYADFREYKTGMLKKETIAVFPELPVGSYEVEGELSGKTNATVYGERVTEVKFR